MSKSRDEIKKIALDKIKIEMKKREATAFALCLR